MARIPVVFTLLLSSLLVSLMAHKGTTVLNIVSPRELNETDANFSLANFGYVPWGKTQLGNVYLGAPSNGCSELQPINFTEFDTSPVILLEWGGCAFTHMAHNAQNIGARMLIVVDNFHEHAEQFEMMDDHSGIGKLVHIPVIMVGGEKGQALKKAAQEFADARVSHDINKKKVEPVTLQITFNWPRQEKASYEFWITPSDDQSMAFLTNFKEAGNKLMDSANWEPHYPILHCEWCAMSNYSQDYADCYGGGRYCMMDPDGDRQLTGRHILEEIIHQACIFRLYKHKFFDYIEKYNQRCFKNIAGLGTLRDCSVKAMTDVGINNKTIFECREDSFEGDYSDKEGLRDNKILRNEYEKFKSRQLAFWPAVFINNNTFKGNLVDGSVYQAICMGFKEIPRKACKSAVLDTDQIIPDARMYNGETYFWEYFTLTLVILIISMVVFFFFYRRIVRRAMVAEMNDQINSAVATYFRMSDQAKADQFNLKVSQ